MYRVCKVDDASALALAQAVRRKVFVEEQGVSLAIELDGLDAECLHVVAWHGDKVIGTGRMLPMGSEFKVGRMAVLPEYRGQGVGGKMLAALLDMAARAGATKVGLHAQSHAIPFYERHGFRVTSPEFIEAGIKHVCMEVNLKTESQIGEGAQG